MKSIPWLVAAGFLAVTTPAFGQEVSGNIAIVSSYIDDDGYNYSAKEGKGFGPAAQAELDISFGNCGVNFWGSKTLGSELGDELDSTLYCTLALGEKTEVTGSIAHYAFAGNDMIGIELSVAHEFTVGTADFTVSEYTWKNNQDVTRFQIGFSPVISEDFDLRLYGTHETGFDLPDITTVGVAGEYALNEQFALTATLVAPVNRQMGDPRKTVFAIGLSYSF